MPTRPPRPSPPRRSRPRADAAVPAAGYTTREVADVLDLPTSRLHAWARQGLLRPARGPRGAYVFSFRDLALLRTAEELLAADIPARRVRAALARLRELLPPGRPLSAVELTALGGRVLVREEGRLWDPDTGQLQMVLDEPADGASVHPLAEAARPGRALGHGAADDWFERGVQMEGVDAEEAQGAYRRALELDPAFADAYLNLGRLLHEAGALDEAELQYRAALGAEPHHARAWYNLGVLLEDRDRPVEALVAYGSALAADPALAVAHWNVARLHERADREADALRHLATYKRLVDGGRP